MLLVIIVTPTSPISNPINSLALISQTDTLWLWYDRKWPPFTPIALISYRSYCYIMATLWPQVTTIHPHSSYQLHVKLIHCDYDNYDHNWAPSTPIVRIHVKWTHCVCDIRNHSFTEPLSATLMHCIHYMITLVNLEHVTLVLHLWCNCIGTSHSQIEVWWI